MPREVKEIQNFNVGTVLNASERDIPDNASSYSLNVNPMAEDGILSAINTNKLFFVSNDKMFRFTTPISRTAYYNTTEATSQKGTGYAFVDDKIGRASQIIWCWFKCFSSCWVCFRE
jgi:hypothetical protein